MKKKKWSWFHRKQKSQRPERFFMGYKLKSGYIQLNTKVHRKKYEHRIVWEEHNGSIPDGFDIHHKNEIKDDNTIDNLELIKKDEHTRHHHTMTDIKTKFLIAEIRRGQTIKDLAQQLKICRNSIYARLNGLGSRKLANV